MAVRPVFVPSSAGNPMVERRDVKFKWFPGMSIGQKQRSIASLHQAATRTLGVDRILEISSKSVEKVGVALSAFNLSVPISKLGRRLSVECAYQGSKVFENGGPYSDIYSLTAREAKRDERLRTSGQLIGFRFFGEDWPVSPPTAFYDWLYINILLRNVELAEQIDGYSAFTDIEFNPERSMNCQANAAALFVALSLRGLLQDALGSREAFMTVAKANESQRIQRSLEAKPLLL